jgi:outer membrane protein assembly factor BamB
LERFLILGGRLYALSDRNYIVSLNRETGDFVFSRPYAAAEFGILGVDLYGEKLISIVGNKLVEIDSGTGRELRSKRLEYGVTCPAARNSLYYYVAGADRLLRTYRAEDMVKLLETAADNKSLITSVIADDGFVFFATVAGNVLSMEPGRRGRRWQFDAGDSILGPIVKDGESLYVSSKDTYVYKLSVYTGTPPVWKYQAEAILDKAPQVTQGVVYQYVHGKGLTAIDKASGSFMWQVEQGLDLLAETQGRAYVMRRGGELVVMDNMKKERLYSVNFSRVSRYATNLSDSKIYIGDDAGRIACLRPVE